MVVLLVVLMVVKFCKLNYVFSCYGRQCPRILMELWTSMASYPHATMDVNALESSCWPGRLNTLVPTLLHRLVLTHDRSLGCPPGSNGSASYCQIIAAWSQP